MVWLEQRTEEERAGLAVAKEERRKEEVERERVRLEVGALRKEKETLRPEDERLRMDVQRSREELKELRSGFEDFERKGFNSTILFKLRTVGDKSGAEVWEILQDCEGVQKLREEIAAGSRRVAEVEDKVVCLEDQEREKKNNVSREQGKLDVFKRAVVAFRDLADSLNLAAKGGFAPEHLEAVQFALIGPEIPRVIARSIERLLPILTDAQSLADLKGKINLARTGLAEVLKDEQEARMRVETIQNTALKVVEGVKTAGENAITDVAMRAKIEVNNAISQFGKDLNTLIVNSRAHVNLSTGELAKLRQQMGQLLNLILPAQVLLGILDSTDDLRNLQPVMVIRVLEGLQLWIELQMPTALINADYNQANGELSANALTFTFYKISSLIKLAIEALRQQLVKSQEKMAGSN